MLKLRPMAQAKAIIAISLLISACSSGSNSKSGEPVPDPAGGGKTFPRIDASKCVSESIRDSRPQFPGFSYDNETPQTRLAEYIDRGDESCVKAILAKGAKPNETIQKDNWPNGKITMLPIFAALNKDQLWRDGKEVGVLRALVEGGADVNAKNDQGETPLQIALSSNILKEYPNASTYLISTKKCNLEQRDRNGLTPIWSAMLSDALATVSQLIAAGADVSVAHPQGQNLLQAALNRGADAQTLAITLVQKGVDPMASNRDGENSLHTASRMKQTDVVNAILQKNVNINAQSNAGETALYLAVRAGANPIAIALINKGANVNLAARKGAPIHQALIDNNTELFNAILPKVTDVNVLSESKSTPLLLAARHCSGAQVKALLDRGANANLADSSGTTPLMVALAADQTDKVTELISKSDVNQKDTEGKTAVFFAQNTTQLQNLLNHRADLNVRSNSGMTVLATAIKANNSDLASFIIERGADVSWKNADGDTLLHVAIGNSKFAVARALLERKIDANAKNIKGRTPMFNATGPQAVNLLVEFKGNINQTDSNDISVISEMVNAQLTYGSQWALSVIQRLVELNVNVDVKGEGGAPLIHNVVGNKGFSIRGPRVKDEAKLLSLLLDGGAKINGLDSKRNTALHLADTANEVGVLIQKGADRNIKNVEQKIPQQWHLSRKQGIELAVSLNQTELDKINEDLKKYPQGSAMYNRLMVKKRELDEENRTFTQALDEIDKILLLLK